jgi:hypothetical protein
MSWTSTFLKMRRSGIAGHGQGLSFRDDPELNDAALLTAEATKFIGAHVLTRRYALYFLKTGIFDEIAVFMDLLQNGFLVSSRPPNYSANVSSLAEPAVWRAAAERHDTLHPLVEQDRVAVPASTVGRIAASGHARTAAAAREHRGSTHPVNSGSRPWAPAAAHPPF